MLKRITLLSLVFLLWGCTRSTQESATASLILYSGMPDPTWELTNTELREFTRRMEALPLALEGVESSYLGYRGIHVFFGGIRWPSQIIRVTNSEVIVRTGEDVTWYIDTDRELERWLLETGKAHVKDVEYEIALNSFSPGFAMYLLDIPQLQQGTGMAFPQAVEVEDALGHDPLITIEDVVSYAPDTYELTLTADAYARYDALLPIPVAGLRFVVTVHDNVVYEGTFCTPLSSMSNEGIVIQKWVPDDSPVLRFQLGYPESPELFEGEDLRNADEILEAFRLAGKLQD